ncbi:MAG TPA: hypothetical protein ENI34_02395, partial [candidate division WOR-3 bacterium]|nr:hypothetical protein [candidate division WOR-3 bacterium]
MTGTKRLKAKGLCIGLLMTLLIPGVLFTIPLEEAPFWQSAIVDEDSRDIALGDMDRDGDLDLAVVSEVSKTAYIYRNDGGTLDTLPSWSPHEVARHLGVAWGDIDNDGYPELAISCYSGLKGLKDILKGKIGQEYPGTQVGGWLYLYKNNNGILDTIAFWKSQDFDGFPAWIGFGDVHGDGYLDLAVATFFGISRIFYNQNGVLDTLPGWSNTDCIYMNVGSWGDVDDDGDLDLALGPDHASYLYYNNNGNLEQTASWKGLHDWITGGMAWADISGNNYLDLACGNGEIVKEPNIVFSNIDGNLDTSYSWKSADASATWRIAFADVDNDGDMDLAMANGCYNIIEKNVVYANQDTILDTLPTWYSQDECLSFGIAWGDIDMDGLQSGVDSIDGDGTRKLFYLKHWPYHSIQEIIVNGNPVPLSDYCFDISSGWVSLKNAPPSGTKNLVVKYKYSIDLDLLIGNEDASDVMYRNTTIGIAERPNSKSVKDFSLQIYPNPFSKKTEIRWTSGTGHSALGESAITNDQYPMTISIYNVSGRLIKSFSLFTPHSSLISSVS